jgi:hypothetical protein
MRSREAFLYVFTVMLSERTALVSAAFFDLSVLTKNSSFAAKAVGNQGSLSGFLSWGGAWHGLSRLSTARLRAARCGHGLR